MNNIDTIKAKLIQFIAADKFDAYIHLQPAARNATEEDKAFISNEINACCQKLVQKIEEPAPTDDALKAIVRESLESIEDEMLDTEDREFCYELLHEIGEILGIDIENHSIPMEQKLLNDMLRLAQNAGINLQDFMPNNKP